MQNYKKPWQGGNGMYKNRLLARKVYDAAILLTVLGQEGGLVLSEGFPKPPFS